MKYAGKERRQYGPSRVTAQLRVEFLGDPPKETRSINISHNGLLIEAEHTHEIDTFVRLRVYTPPDQQPFEVLCRVASQIQKQGRDAIGIQFVEISPEDQKRWLEYVLKVEKLTSGKERRKSSRLQDAYVVRFKSRDRLEEFFTKNISSGGLFISTSSTKSLGDRVQVVLVHPESGDVFELEAEVSRLDGQGATGKPMGMALKFSDLDGRKEEALKKFLK